MISIIVNDEPMPLAKGCTVDALMKHLAMQNAERIAIAVNDKVVSRSRWPQHELAENDRVLMFAPIQGG